MAPKKAPPEQIATHAWRPGQSLLVPIAEPPKGPNKAIKQPASRQAIQTDEVDPEDDPAFYITNTSRSARVYNRPTATADGFTFQQGDKRYIYHNTPIPQRRSAPSYQQLSPPPYAPSHQVPQSIPDETDFEPRHHMHWLTWVGGALFFMLIGWIALTYLSGWAQTKLNDWQYGSPRTAQYDVQVGHNDSAQNKSHFIVQNLKRRVEIIEYPGGDTAHARIFQGPILLGAGADLAPITLEFRDVTGDGKPDMIIHVQDTVFVFINDSGTFRPQRQGEHINL